MLYVSSHGLTIRYMFEQNLLTVKEVAVFLKLSLLTIYKYIRERKLEAIQFGGHYRIDKQSLDKFINSHKLSENSPPDPMKEADKTNEK